MIISAILLFIAFVSLIGVRFAPRSGQSKHVWLVFCVINLITVAIININSLKKARKVKILESDIEAVRDYSEVSRLDLLGYPLGYGIKSDHAYDSALTCLFEGMYTVKDEKLSMRLGPEAEQRYREITQKFPKFPFGHYYLAFCLRESGNNEWREHAQQALEIFKITTRIDGHRSHHDEFLKMVSEWLEER